MYNRYCLFRIFIKNILPLSKKYRKRLKNFTGYYDGLLNIGIRTSEYYNYCLYFYQGRTKEDQTIIENTPYFKFMASVFYQQCVLELAKVYSVTRNDDFRLKAFFNKLALGGPWRILIRDEMDIEAKSLFLTNHKDKIDKIKKLRDEWYAHSDKKVTEFGNISISLDELGLLVEFLVDFIEEIRIKILKIDEPLNWHIADSDKLDILCRYSS